MRREIPLDRIKSTKRKERYRDGMYISVNSDNWEGDDRYNTEEAKEKKMIAK